MKLIPKESALADIGSDHALLPVAAVQSGRAVRAVAGEVNDGPLQAAAKQVAEGQALRTSFRSARAMAWR